MLKTVLYYLIFSPTFLFAQNVNLKTVLNEASAGSPLIEKSQAQYDEVSWKKTEALQGFLPTLTGGINYYTLKKYTLTDINLGSGPVSVPQIVPTTTYSLTATIPLFDGFASTNRYLAGSHLEKSAQLDLDWTRFSLQKNITLQFYKVIAARSLKEVSEQNLKTLTDHLKDAEALKKAGIATSYDVLRVEVQVSEAKAEILNASDNFEIAKNKLGELLGKDTETRDLEGSFPKISNETLQTAKVLKLSSRADLLALQEKSQSLQNLDSAAGRYWVPKIGAFGQYQYYNNINDHFSDSDHFRESYLVGLNMTWNLFDGMGSIAKSHQAAAQSIQLQANVKITELKAKQDFEFWKRKLNYFKTIYDSKIIDIEKSSESVRLAQAGRRAGTRTSTDLLDSELDLFRSRASLVNAQIGLVESIINIELSTGLSIYDFEK